MTRSTQQSTGNPNRSQNLANSQIGANKSSRYNKLIGIWNPSMLYQTQQCWAYNSSQPKTSGPTSPKNQKKMQVSNNNNNLIKKEANDPVCAFNLNSGMKYTSQKKADKKRRTNCKYYSSKAKKTSSAARSLSKKITSPYNKISTSKERNPTKLSSATQTAREMNRTSRKEKPPSKKDPKNVPQSTSKLSNLVNSINNASASDINSNLYRNIESRPYQGRNKPAKPLSTNTTIKKRIVKQKHHSSTNHPLEKQPKTVDLTNPATFTTQLFSLIQKIHSPKSSKSHNHSHSEVQSKAVKRVVKGRQTSKIAKKSSMHVRSNTSENPKKFKIKQNQFMDYSGFFRSINNEGTAWASPGKDGLKFCNSVVSHHHSKPRSKSKKGRKSQKSLYPNNTVTYQNPMTPQNQGSISNENTFINFQKNHNKSLWGGGTIGSMGTIMSSFGLQSAKSTWIKPNDGKSKPSPPKQHPKSSCGKKLKVDYLKHLKLESNNVKQHLFN